MAIRKMSDYKRRFEEALRDRDSGRIAEAEDTLRALVAEHGERPEAKLMLGGLYFDQGNFVKAIELLRPLTDKHPASETSSLCLFHSLWALDRRDEAITEMQRYLADFESLEYSRLRRDLEEAGFL